MNLTVIASAIAAALGFGTAWSIQSQRLTKQELDHAQERIASQAAARKTIERTTSAVIQAQNQAMERSRVLRAAADAARGESDGLRNSISVAMRAATVSHEACIERTNAFGFVLDICGRTLTDLGAKADGHASDVRTLTDAWPR